MSLQYIEYNIIMLILFFCRRYANVHFDDASCSAYFPYRKSVNFINVAKLASFYNK